MRRAVERKVRSRAQQIYESRGQAEGKDLQDWFQAEAEVIENSALAPIYRRMLKQNPDKSAPQSVEQQVSCETTV
ncbi:MAG TPA: DUF2934 domain-containing protein [Candidatus Sulfotelmatobacter sp.]|nr:DUF2934 domain-containing protein [Candidatus Sulfotelmatobacter sp.]